MTIDGIYFYRQEELPDDPTETTVAPTTGNSPDTADEMSIVPFAAAAIISCVAIVYVVAARKKVSKEK